MPTHRALGFVAATVIAAVCAAPLATASVAEGATPSGDARSAPIPPPPTSAPAPSSDTVAGGTGIVTSVAGGLRPGPNGAQETAMSPSAVAVAGETAYVADTRPGIDTTVCACVVRAIDLPTGTQRIVAGNGTTTIDGDGGPATAAGIGRPERLATDHLGRVLISTGGFVRRVETDGAIVTIAGTGTLGTGGDGGPAKQASILTDAPAVDALGQVFLAAGSRIRRIDSAGTITTAYGSSTPADDGDGGPATGAHFLDIEQVAFDSAGNLIVLQHNGRLRSIGADGIVRAMATVPSDGLPAAQSGNDMQLTADHHQRLVVSSLAQVFRIDEAQHTVTAIAGGGLSYDDGVPATAATFPYGLAVATTASDTVLVADPTSRRLREIGPDGVIETVAGATASYPNPQPYPAAPGDQAQLELPGALAVDPKGDVILSAVGIRRVSDGRVTALSPALPPLMRTRALAPTGDGSVLVLHDDHTISRVTPFGAVEPFAGLPTAPASTPPKGDGGPATAAHFSETRDVVRTPDGSTYVSEGRICKFFGSSVNICWGNNDIRRIDPSGIVTTIVKGGDPSVGGAPIGDYQAPLAADQASNVYFFAGAKLYRRSPSGSMTVVAGNGERRLPDAPGEDGAPATTVAINPAPFDVSPSGEIYVTDWARRVLMVRTDGTIHTIAAATSEWRGDGLPAIGGGFSVADVAVDGARGRLFMTDVHANRLLVTSIAPSPPSPPAAVAGDGEAHVSWTAPSSELPVTGYRITAWPGAQSVDVGLVTSTRVAALTNGTSYRFTVAARSSDGLGGPSALSAAVVPTAKAVGSRFHAVAPTRIFDSRDGTGGPREQVGWMPRDLTAAPLTDPAIPDTASALVMNVTAVYSSRNAFITLWPAGFEQPKVSNLNVAAGQIIPNLVTVKIGSGNKIRIATSEGAVDVIADVVGWYDDGQGAGDAYVGVTPKRLLDSRTSATAGWPGTPLPAGPGRTLIARGATTGVPATATTIIANVTVTESTANSFVSVRPTGALPGASNLNFAAGETIANLVTVGIGTDGTITLTTAQGATHIVVDLVGYYDPTASGGRFHPLTPVRALDDRIGLGGYATPWGPTPPEPVRAVNVAGSSGVPAGATGIVMNTTVTNATTGSYLSVYPDGAQTPITSTLNFGRGQTLPNLAVLPLPANGQLRIANHIGHTDVIADLAGYFSPT
jgi:hypothetical protein